MAEEKKIQLQSFTGCMDTDTADELLPADRYRSAQNIRVLSTEGGTKGIVTNLKGTVEVSFTRPAGQNITIGAGASEEQNKFFFFEWNANGYHSIYMYDGLLNQVIRLMQNLTDTDDVDVLQFKKRSLILHIDVIGDLLYWTDGQVKQKKLNWRKILDISNAGYGPLILGEYISAYKRQAIFPPSLSYFTDTARLTNYLFGNLFKASNRPIFDDGEKGNWSEFSTVPLPATESFTGNAAVSNVNNCLKISVETGSRIVKKIEIAIKIGSGDFVSIITLDKEELSISNDSLYVYSFYNDNNSFSGIDQDKVNRAYSFMPDIPLGEAFVDRAIVYMGGREGFPVVPINVSVVAAYTDLFLPDATVSALNVPFFSQTAFVFKFTRVGHGRRTNALVTLKVGSDVKIGNKFELFGRNGKSDNLYFTYTATGADDAISVANNFKQQLIVTGRILSDSEDFPATDIWANTIVSGDVSFSFILRGRFNEAATSFEGRVNPVSTQTLKDIGQAVRDHKSGGSVKYGISYWNEDTKRSSSYTSDNLFIRTNFVTESAGYKKVVHDLSIKHQPPVWATHYDITRTIDLTYGTNWIDILIQKAIESQSTTNTDYVDLVIGSLFTYQKMYPNTVLQYTFEKNDRVRLIKKTSDNSYYTFLETVVLDYKDILSEDKTEDVTTNNTNTVTIGGTTSSDNIGRYISIDGTERLITAAPTGTTYTLDRTFGTAEKYPAYKIIDRRGIIRVRKPVGVTIEDNSVIEVYKPTQNIQTVEKQMFIFGHKYAIKNWGTSSRCHTGNKQNQDPLNPISTPAIVSIENGMSYLKQRQLPTNNSIPGTQAVTSLIEDKNYSDFYDSDLNDNGKISVEDDATGEKYFPERLRFSNNYIQDTKINGLNDFESLDRKDYNDPNGAFKLIKFHKGLLYSWKVLDCGYIPIYAIIIQGKDGNNVGLSTSNKLLNEIKYFGFEAGIGNMPMSWAREKNWHWFASPNTGTFCRTGGDGILPISQQFDLDSRLRALIARSDKYGAFVFGGFDAENNEYQPSFEAPKEYLFNAGFDESMFELFREDNPEGTEYEITTQPVNGDVVIDVDGNFVFTPDTDYVGSDFFYYRWRFPAGAWSTPKKECLLVNPKDIPDSPSIYYNVEMVTAFVRDNCNPGYHGTSVNYTVPQYKYSSPYSQGNADQQATDETNANGQSWANDPANGGTCIIDTPDAFTFTDVTGATVSTNYTSNTITVAGLGAGVSVAVTVVGGLGYSKNGGAFTAAAGTAANGDTFAVSQTSSASTVTATDVTLTIGGVSDTYTVATEGGAVLGDFDYLVFEAIWVSGSGTDLDTYTGFIGTGTIYDGDPASRTNWVGFNQNPIPPATNGNVPANRIIPQGSATPYLNWGTDNTTGAGTEGILVDMKTFVLDFPSTPNPVEVKMNAVWYSARTSGDITVKITTYKGGTMALVGTTFVNTGGVLVNDVSLPFNVLNQNITSLIANSSPVAILNFNKTTNSATLILQ